MPTNFFRQSCIFLVLVMCSQNVVSKATHPLEPLDLSSPKATLNSFLTSGDEGFRLIRDEYWDSPSDEVALQITQISSELQRTLDLSGIPPAAHFELSRDGYIYLYEILSHIELPDESDIPDADFYADTDSENDKVSGDEAVSWTIPHTEITLTRIEKGPQAGHFLFSSSTVARIEEFYEKTRTLPYRRDVPLENYAEMRPYLSIGGWMMSMHTISRFPDWLKYSVLRQAVWKWIALVMLISISFDDRYANLPYSKANAFALFCTPPPAKNCDTNNIAAIDSVST